MDFWDIIWFIIVTFAFVAYLMVFFSILSDLFRDKETGGFAKAIWIIALIFFPFFAALIYLIARGQGMAERNVKAAKEMQDAQSAYIRDVAGQLCRRPDSQGEGAARLRCDLAGGVRRHQGEGSRLETTAEQGRTPPPMGAAFCCSWVLAATAAVSRRHGAEHLVGVHAAAAPGDLAAAATVGGTAHREPPERRVEESRKYTPGGIEFATRGQRESIS